MPPRNKGELVKVTGERECIALDNMEGSGVTGDGDCSWGGGGGGEEEREREINFLFPQSCVPYNNTVSIHVDSW